MTQKDLTLFFVWCWFQLTKKRKLHALRCKRYQANHPERLALQRHRAYLRRKTAHREYQRGWVRENLSRNRKLKRDWNAQQRATNPGWKLRTQLTIRIWGALKHVNRRAARTMGFLGCSFSEFKEHLQKQFSPGMSWENYGKWHVDHKRPCASFDLTDPAQQRECFHFSNLQPLWARDNLSKGAKLCAA